MYKNLLQTNVLLLKQNSDLICEINRLNKQNYDQKCKIRELQKQLGKLEYEPLPELQIKEFNSCIDDLHETFEYKTDDDNDDEFIEEFKPEEPEEPQQQEEVKIEPEPEPEPENQNKK
jgi:hypothetical protein